MAQYIAFDDTVEVNGRTLLATIAGGGEGIYELLAEHGITTVEPDQWYSQQVWLDVLLQVGSGLAGAHGPIFDLVSIGMHIPAHADWPPGVNDIESALDSINDAYHMNHRNGEIGTYQAKRVNDHQIVVEAQNPYPSDFDYGLIYGLAKRFLPDDTFFKVVRADAPSRTRGDDKCIYHVIWE